MSSTPPTRPWVKPRWIASGSHGAQPKNTSMSGMLAPRISAARPLRVCRLEPGLAERPAGQRMGEIVQLSAALQRRSELARLFLDLPGLALGDQRLEVGRLARGGGGILLDHRAFEGRRRIFVDDAERDREALPAFRPACARSRGSSGRGRCTAGSSPSTTFSASGSTSSAMPLVPPANSIFSPALQPQLLVGGDVACR